MPAFEAPYAGGLRNGGIHRHVVVHPGVGRDAGVQRSDVDDAAVARRGHRGPKTCIAWNAPSTLTSSTSARPRRQMSSSRRARTGRRRASTPALLTRTAGTPQRLLASGSARVEVGAPSHVGDEKTRSARGALAASCRQPVVALGAGAGRGRRPGGTGLEQRLDPDRAELSGGAGDDRHRLPGRRGHGVGWSTRMVEREGFVRGGRCASTRPENLGSGTGRARRRGTSSRCRRR